MARKKIMKEAKHLGVMIEEQLHDDLEYYSGKSGMNISQAVREAIEKWLQSIKQNIL